MQRVIGQHQVDQRVGVRVQAEVFIVVARESMTQSMRVVQHRSDAVESEAIELVLFHPEAQIGQQETQHFDSETKEISKGENPNRKRHLLRVIEETAVPQVMEPTRIVMEVATVGSVPLVQAVRNVLASVAVDDVQKNIDARFVRHVDQVLQIVWRTEATGSCEEAGDLVTEACIVCVFHNGHQLDRVVA